MGFILRSKGTILTPNATNKSMKQKTPLQIFSQQQNLHSKIKRKQKGSEELPSEMKVEGWRNWHFGNEAVKGDGC